MKSTHSKRALALTMAAILASALPAWAADHSNDSAARQQGLSSEQSGEQLRVSEQEMQKQVKDANKASKLIGMQVKNLQDEDLGKIKDVVIDLQQGKVAYAVLSVGSTLGFGGRNVAVPITALRVARGEESLLIDVPKQQVASAPGFSDEQWPNLDAAKTGQTIGLAQSSSQSQSQGGAGSDQQTTTGTGSSTNAYSTGSSDTNSLGGASDPSSSSSGAASDSSDTNSLSSGSSDSSSSEPETE